MKKRYPLIALLLCASPLLAQNRDFQAERIVLDDASGNTITIQTPAGPITGGTLTIPDPGGPGTFLISNPSSGSQSVAGDLLPDQNATYSLGSSALQWSGVFASGAVVASSMRITEPGGADYTEFAAQAQAGNITYTLPALVGGAGAVLSIAASPAPTANAATLQWGAGGAAGPAGGDLSGTYPNPTIATSAVTGAKILDSTITTADIAAGAAIPYSKLTLTNSIQNGDIVANAITTSKVANGTVTTSKMADSAISGLKLLTFAVTNRHLASQAVTADKISPTGAASGDVLSYNGANVVWAPAAGASGAAGGDLTGTYPNPTIADNAITSIKIADGNVNNQDIAVNAITTSKVANGTVTTSKMADSAISGLKLLTFAVRDRHIADGAVTLPKINPTGANTGDVLSYNGANLVWAPAGGAPTGAAGGDLSGTYPNPTIATSAVTGAKILDSTITTADIASNAAIPYSKLTLTNSIQNGDIVANAITTSKVANGTVTTSKLADSAVSGLKLLTFAVTNRHLASQAVTADKISPTGAASGDVLSYNGTSVVWTAAGSSPTGAAGGDLTGTYPNPTIATSAVTGAKILDSTITDADVAAGAAIHVSKLNLTNGIQNSHLVANSVTTSKVANGTVTTSKLADSAVSGLKLLTFAVTNRHLASAAVTTDKISTTGATTGNSLLFNGTNVAWGNPATKYARTTVSGVAGGTTYNAATVDEIIGVDVTSGPVTVNLPSASTAGSGKVIIVKNELGNAGTNNITINRSGTDLINAASTSVGITTGTGTGSFRFYSDGVSRWHQF